VKKNSRYTMNSLDQVRVLAHPLRLRLLELFAEHARTTSQAAAELQVPVTRLYHHVNALEKVGLVRLKETRPVRGTVEKYYEAVARKMVIGTGVFRGRREGLTEVLASVLDEARKDLEAALDRMPETSEDLHPIALRAMITASPAQIVALRKKWLKLLKEPLGTAGAKGRGAKARLTFVFTAERDPKNP
jgi:predicted ArsR family transcriptional regulator